MKPILIAILLAIPISANAQLPKEFSVAFHSAQMADVRPYSSTSGQDVFGVNYATSCKNNNCVGVSQPLSIPATAYVAIFRSGDWRIAAYCFDELGGCSKPQQESAWIRFQNGGIRVIFMRQDKQLTQEEADKKLRKFLNFKNFWQIGYIYNASTKTFWPPQQDIRQALTTDN